MRRPCLSHPLDGMQGDCGACERELERLQAAEDERARENETKHRDPIAWSCHEDEEHLIHTDRDSAIESYLDEVIADAAPLEQIPRTVEVFGFARLTIDVEEVVGVALDVLLERIDEEYGDPDDSYSRPTLAMEQAERKFIAAVLADYEPWACEVVCSESVDTLAWIREHRPDWLVS